MLNSCSLKKKTKKKSKKREKKEEKKNVEKKSNSARGRFLNLKYVNKKNNNNSKQKLINK